MKALAFFFTLLLVVIILAFSYEQEPLAVIKKLAPEKEIASKIDTSRYLLVGEASHGDIEAWKFTKNLICEIAEKIEFVGFEMTDSSLQKVIRKKAPVSSLGILYGNEAVHSEFLKILDIISQINIELVRLGRDEIDLVGLDLPRPNIQELQASSDKTAALKAMSEWFMARDSHMVETILTSGRKGIIHMGAAHTSKTQFKWPEEVKRQMPMLPEKSRPAGYLLNSGDDLGILVGSKTDIEQFSKHIPKTWVPFWSFINSFGKTEDHSQLYSTSNTDYINHALSAFSDEYDGMNVTTGYDQFIYLGTDYNKTTSNTCPSLGRLKALRAGPF